MKARALVLALFLLGALAVPASAAHPNVMCVDVGADESHGTSGDDIIEYVRATIGTNDADHEPPAEEGCIPLNGDFGGTEMDFEITGVADPDSSDTPLTPDMTCTIAAGDNNCAIYPPASDGGTQTVRAWIDSDHDDVTTEGDTGEGADEETMPGNQPEPDGTDVTTLFWRHMDPPCGTDYVCDQTISISYRRWRGTFYGSITRENADCAPSRVVVWRARPGDDTWVAATTADDDGWRVHTGRRRGRFYAVLARTWVDVPNSEPPWRNPCQRNRSPVIEVR